MKKVKKSFFGGNITLWSTPTKEDNQFEEVNRRLGLNNIPTLRTKIIISKKCHQYIASLHEEFTSKERLAICKMERTNNNEFTMVDMIHPHQKAHGSEVETTDEGMERQMQYLMENDKENIHKWNCVLHSHHSMGVFWSGTDNNARLWLNDGRFMSFAIVTAYDKSDKRNISYKGCVNFYQPYNIEIDADIEYEDFDALALDEYKKIFNEALPVEKARLLEERKEELNPKIDSLFKEINDFLGVDFTDELVKNYTNVVNFKYPNKAISGLIDEIEKEAEKNVMNMIMETNSELIQRLRQSNEEVTLFENYNSQKLAQLKEHMETTKFDNTYAWYYWSWGEWEKPKQKKNKGKNKTKPTEWYYNDSNFATVMEIKDILSLPSRCAIIIGADRRWMWYDRALNVYVAIDDLDDDQWERIYND